MPSLNLQVLFDVLYIILLYTDLLTKGQVAITDPQMMITK